MTDQIVTVRHRRTVAAVIREIARLKPEVIVVRYPRGCVEVSLPILFGVWAESGIRQVCTHEVTVPRRGWVVLMPRKL